jgi:hypothetical protein
MNKSIDDLDMPELTDEMLTELKPNVDLHLGAAEVKQFKKDWWAEKYGPKKPGLEIYALDALIIMLASIVIDLIILSWMHVLS